MDMELYEIDDESFDTISSSSDSSTYDPCENWPIHADCTYDFSDSDGKEVWKLTPRTLKSLTAIKLVQLDNPDLIISEDLPPSIIPTLFTEACRLHSETIIGHIVSIWPFKILNLKDVEVPMDCYQGYFTKSTEGTACLADVMIRGLLTRKPSCKMRTLILPEDESESAALIKKFILLPLFALMKSSKTDLIQTSLETVSDIDLMDHVKSLTTPDYEISSQCLLNPSGDARMSIVIPSAVIQWIGKNKNFREVIIGLSLTPHTHFTYSLERVAICNMLDVNSVRAILQRVPDPKTVRKLVFYHRHPMNSPDVTCNLHPLVRLAYLQDSLTKYTGLEGFNSKSYGMYTPDQNFLNKIEMTIQTSEVFTHWTSLKELDLSGNPLTNILEALLSSLERPLNKLSLSDTELNKEDLKYLSGCHHLGSLHTLSLDFNNLHLALPVMVKLFKQLSVICHLRTRQCQFTYSDVVILASALEHSHTIRSWNLLHNPIGGAQDIKRFIRHCSKIPGLKEIGCKPTEVQAIFGAYFVHTNGPAPLSEDDRRELKQVAEQFKILLY